MAGLFAALAGLLRSHAHRTRGKGATLLAPANARSRPPTQLTISAQRQVRHGWRAPT